jgi:hypothetical protein
MTVILRCLARGGIAPALLALTLFTAGCASEEGSRNGRHPPKTPPPNLTGRETFFDGRIVAELKVGAMTGFDRGPERSAEGGEHTGRRRGGHGRGSGMGGGGHREEGGGTGYESTSPEQTQQRIARQADRAGSPPVMIHLRFTNTGSERAELVIADFLSPLGNFVVTPEKLSLEPGQAVEVEPMASRLAGEISGGEISLNLRLGGRSETKTIALQLEAGPAPQP